MLSSRVNPLNVKPTETPNGVEMLKLPVQSITVGVRIGESVDIAIGLVQKFGWSINRGSTEVYQIEPVVDGTFGAAVSRLLPSDSTSFFSSKYFPGEVIELIPGKQGAAELELSRCVLYGSNIFSALMSIENAGTEATADSGVENSTVNFGGSLLNYVTLIQQVRPIYIKQVVYNPASTTGEILWGRTFEDVWIESWSEEMPDASKNEAVVDTIRAKATRIRPYSDMSKSNFTTSVS